MSLVHTIAQIQAASSIDISNTIEELQPYLDDAEETFIIPIIGDDNYANIVTYDQALGTQTAVGDGVKKYLLLVKIRKAIALYALYLSVDEIAVSLSSAGLHTLQSDTMKPAPQFMMMNLKETLLSRAHRQVDNLLKYAASIPTFLSGFTIPSSPCFIRNADEFQVYADIHASRRVFLSLLPVIASIEQKYIRPTLSPVLFDSLKASLKSGTTLSEDDQALLSLIVPTLVHLTMARALLEISIDMLDWGIFNNSANTFTNIQGKAQANQVRISAMHQANLRDGEAELKMLQEFLDNNASAEKYAAYYASDRYVGPANAVKRGEFVNDALNSFFVV